MYHEIRPYKHNNAFTIYNPHGSTPQCRCCLTKRPKLEGEKSLGEMLGAHMRGACTSSGDRVGWCGISTLRVEDELPVKDMFVVFVETATENASADAGWHLSS
jgi:hypothetical protein